VEDVVSREEIFSASYAYRSSYSRTWLEHCRRYVDMVTERFVLGPGDSVVEIGSNDGYLLQYLLDRDMRIVGIEPAEGVALTAAKRGVPTIQQFFGRDLACQLSRELQADLVIANNVLAHVPNLNDFVSGLAELLAPEGVITLEFPHLLRLVQDGLFDTIYHEHYSYFSLSTARRVLQAHGLAVFDVEEIPTHGGSLRIYARHAGARRHPIKSSVAELQAREAKAGCDDIALYERFGETVRATKREIRGFFLAARRAGCSVAGYGAPAKGNTLLNHCGIGKDLMRFTVDLNPTKQGTILPGSRIPVKAPDAIREEQPEYVFILPWNLCEEIVEQLAYVRQWGGRYVVPMPAVTVID
jgi:2-polyprenyl-3-methyl-5-hydroxy-6-metoxy-1,4-benzoquinol methylase